MECECAISYVLAELFNMSLKESCFPERRKVSSVVFVSKNIKDRSKDKTH